MNNTNIISNTEFLKQEKSRILIDYTAYTAYCKAYKDAHGKDKNGFVSVPKQLDALLVACQNERLSNADIANLKSACQFLLKNKEDIAKLETIDILTFKKKIVEVYKQTKKVGVIVSEKDGKVSKEVGLVGLRGYKVISNMLLLLFTNKQTFVKPPKKDKTKKTIRKK